MHIMAAAILFACLFIMVQNIVYATEGTSAAIEMQKVIRGVKENPKNVKWAARKYSELVRNGAKEYVSKDITLARWYIYKTVMGAVGFSIAFMICKLTGRGQAPVIGIAVGLIGFFFLDIMVRTQNSAENDRMLPDIAEMSRSIMYSVKGGRYISDAIIDSTQVVENTRLKTALIALDGDIQKGQALTQALDDFEAKFNNLDIQALVAVIKSLQTTGQINDALDSLEHNTERAQQTVDKKKAQSLEDKTMLYVMLIAFDLVMIIMFCVGVKIMSMVDMF